MNEGPIFKYRQLKTQGHLDADIMQELAIEKLQSLHNAINGYQPHDGNDGWKIRLGLSRRVGRAPQGLYIYGGVGRGKSMLMDLFFATANIEKKRRVHFHKFMIEIHQKIHQWRKLQKSRKNKQTDPLPKIAKDIADGAWLLCFDEFHVTDIADAMILSRLFAAMFDLGVVVVATSNWPPDDLYKDGLQRSSFLPFIDLIKKRWDFLHLDSDKDYRLQHLNQLEIYHNPLSDKATAKLNAAFKDLTKGAVVEAKTITVKARDIIFNITARDVLLTNFDALCRQALGAEDYIAIAQYFHTVILDGIPKMAAEMRNEAKRLMLLIDALYEYKVKLIMASDVTIDKIYTHGSHSFEFQRSISRLMEMQSQDYMKLPHRID